MFGLVKDFLHYFLISIVTQMPTIVKGLNFGCAAKMDRSYL